MKSIRDVRSGLSVGPVRLGSKRRSVIAYMSGVDGVERFRVGFVTLPFHLKRASGSPEVYDLPHAQHYVQYAESRDGAASIAALHRNRQPGPVHFVGGEYQ